MKKTQTILITFMDGKTMKFTVPMIEGSRSDLANMISQGRSLSNLVLEADGKIIFIPMANVRTLELSPFPAAPAIPGLLMGAKSVS